MAVTGLLVLGVIGVVLILAVLGVIALLSRGEVLPTIVGIALFGFLLLAVGGAAYVFFARAVVRGPVVAPAPVVVEAPLIPQPDPAASNQPTPADATSELTDAAKTSSDKKEPSSDKKETTNEDAPTKDKQPEQKPGDQ